MVRPRMLPLLVLLASCAPRDSREGAGPTRPPSPAPPVGADASDAGRDAPTEPTAEQSARLVAELESLELKAIGSGPPVAAATPEGATQVPGPQGVVQLAAAVGGPPGANAVLARARGGFRSCYQRALAEDPETTGTVTLTLALGPDGHVTQATSSTSMKLVSSLTSCLEARARALRFAAPTGGSDKLVATLTLVKD